MCVPNWKIRNWIEFGFNKRFVGCRCVCACACVCVGERVSECRRWQWRHIISLIHRIQSTQRRSQRWRYERLNSFKNNMAIVVWQLGARVSVGAKAHSHTHTYTPVTLLMEATERLCASRAVCRHFDSYIVIVLRSEQPIPTHRCPLQYTVQSVQSQHKPPDKTFELVESKCRNAEQLFVL